MKSVRKIRIAGMLVLVMLTLAAPVTGWADTITVGNYSFENAALSPWIKTGTGAVWQPWAGVFPGGVPGPVKVAWLHNGSLSQTLTDTIEANKLYTLGAYVARYFATSVNYTITLAAHDGGGDHTLATTTGQASYRSFDHIFVQYTSNTQYIGDQLKIILSSSGMENDFDVVTLTKESSMVPAPSTLLLLSSGLMGLMFLRRRKNRR